MLGCTLDVGGCEWVAHVEIHLDRLVTERDARVHSALGGALRVAIGRLHLYHATSSLHMQREALSHSIVARGE